MKWVYEWETTTTQYSYEPRKKPQIKETYMKIIRWDSYVLGFAAAAEVGGPSTTLKEFLRIDGRGGV